MYASPGTTWTLNRCFQAYKYKVTVVLGFCKHSLQQQASRWLNQPSKPPPLHQRGQPQAAQERDPRPSLKLLSLPDPFHPEGRARVAVQAHVSRALSHDRGFGARILQIVRSDACFPRQKGPQAKGPPSQVIFASRHKVVNKDSRKLQGAGPFESGVTRRGCP